MDVREKLVEILEQAPFEGKVLNEWWRAIPEPPEEG